MEAYLGLLRRTYLIIGIVISRIGLMLLPALPLLIEGGILSGANLYLDYLLLLLATVISFLSVRRW